MAKQITGRIPPQDLGADQAIIAAILLDRDAIVSIIQFLKPEHFYRQVHGDIFGSLCDLYERREPLDLVTLTAQLKRNGNFDNVGGSAYLAELASAVPTAANIAQYAQIVSDHWVKRQLIATG